MTRSYFAGVDGGGTKTHFVLMDGDRNIVGECVGGSSYHLEVGVEGVSRVLIEGLAALTLAAGIGVNDITYSFVGLPAYGEDPATDPLLDRIAATIIGNDRYRCGNDMVCGWAGSLGCEDGINIVAGTGSIGYGERGAATARAGGWGEVISDEGSAYWIAVQGLNAFTRMSDGRLEKGPLYAAFRQRFALTNDIDICAAIMGDTAMPRSEIASLSQLVTAAAGDGDEAAKAIIIGAAGELAQIADALRRSLGFAKGETVPLSYSGGMLKAGSPVLEPFLTALLRLSPFFDIREPKFTPGYGAALYAAKLSGQ